MVLDGSPAGLPSRAVKGNEKGPKSLSTPKRKRASARGSGRSVVVKQDKESIVADCRRRLDEMYELYKEVSGVKLNFEETPPRASTESVIASLIEESRLPYSKLVNEIYETLKSRGGVDLAYVRRTVLSIGKRAMYGVGDPVADVLENESESSLWCWETRDIKLLAMKQREIWNIRRRARKKIHERITLLSEILSSISASASESQDSQNDNLIEALVKLKKMQNVEAIHSLIDNLKQKNDADITMKETEEMETNKQNAEKEKPSVDRELCLEKCQSVKEPKLMQDEAGIGTKRSKKEEVELKKKLKKQQKEAERDQRYREKEEAESKRRHAMKQPTLIECFLRSKKSDSNSAILEQGVSSKGPICDSVCKSKHVVNASTFSMDSAFCQQDNMAAEDLFRSHVKSWHKLSCCNRSSRWGVRRNPKIELIKELKLQKSFSEDELPEGTPLNKGPATSQLLNKKLLQFHDNHRPAYYGVWKKKSTVVTPRRPYQKDPGLDYDVDSDEEWEEESPGESLSDCDKDNEDDYSEEENLKTEDGYESEDSFIVSDGYEGVQVDGEDDARSNPVVESKEFNAFLQKQEYLKILTVKTANKNRPLIISNLMHEKANLSEAKDLHQTSKLEQTCLEALSIQAYPGGSVIDVHDCPSKEDQDVCQSLSINSSLAANAAAIPDSDLPEFVCAIHSNPSRMDDIIEALHQRFPTTPKSQLTKKVYEISDFVNDCWQIKKEVLSRLGCNTPGKVARQKDITTYFSTKQGLPSKGTSPNIPESSPRPSPKTEVDGDAGDNSMQTDGHTTLS